MPGFDRTGPKGQGSQTGRRTGKCNPNNETTNDTTSESRPGKRKFRFLFDNRNQDNQGFGRGQRSGRQRGFGRGSNQS